MSPHRKALIIIAVVLIFGVIAANFFVDLLAPGKGGLWGAVFNPGSFFEMPSSFSAGNPFQSLPNQAQFFGDPINPFKYENPF